KIYLIEIVAENIIIILYLVYQDIYGLRALLYIPDTMAMQIIIIVLLVIAAAISAATGVHKGIRILSTYNVYLALFLIVVLLILGPALFISNSYLEAMATYVENFLTLNAYRGDEGWLSSWTIFFFAWFLGYGPMMAMFVTRISRGRTIRQLVTSVAIIAPIISTFWFTVVGGTGIYQELMNPGSVSDALNSNGPPAAMIAITEQLPFGTIIGFLFIVATIIFVL